MKSRIATFMILLLTISSIKSMQLQTEQAASTNVEKEDEKYWRKTLLRLLKTGRDKEALLIINSRTIKLNIPSEKFELPLIVAVSGKNNPNVIAALLSKGAFPNLKDIRGRTALSEAATRMNWLAKQYIKILLDAGADIDLPGEGGNTPLMKAVSYGEPKNVELLIAQGANPTLTNKEGKTALDVAEAPTGLGYKLELRKLLKNYMASYSEKKQKLV